MAMDIRKYYIPLGIFIISLLTIFSCKPKKNCNVFYQVHFPFNLHAKSDTISIGDTVYLDVNLSRNFKEVLSGNNLYLPEEFIKHNIAIFKLDKDSVNLDDISSTGGLSDFNSLSLIGSLGPNFHNWERLANYIFTKDSAVGSYRFIAKDTGTFVFYLSDAAYYNYHSPLSKYNISFGNIDCTESYWHGLFVNDNIDNNYYIIQKRHAFFDTTSFKYYNFNDPNYDLSDRYNPNNKNFVNDQKQNLKLGTFSVVVK